MSGSQVDASSDGVRLQKLMAAAGVASRRVSEDLIAAGRVEVNGEVVTELGRRVLKTDRIAVDGVAIQLDTSRRYLMLNKPVGIVSSLQDERGRPDLGRYVSRYEERLFNVGRLDAQTSGLLILTNDGELAHVLAHPSFGVMKTYIAKVEGRMSAQTVGKLTSGIDLEDGPIAADKARILSISDAAARRDGSGKGAASAETMVEVTLHSGRNRIVRRMLDAVGHPVVDLVRRQFGPLHLGPLASGQLRELTKAELGQLLTISRDAQGQPNAGILGENTGRQTAGDQGGAGDRANAGDQTRAGDRASAGDQSGTKGQSGARGQARTKVQTSSRDQSSSSKGQSGTRDRSGSSGQFRQADHLGENRSHRADDDTKTDDDSGAKVRQAPMTRQATTEQATTEQTLSTTEPTTGTHNG